MLNFNTDPYYDDFDPSNNYHKILFRPGRAVQARELTQSQTILQSQISNFADHFFTQNTPVKGGKLTINTNVEYLKLNYEYAGVEIVASDFKNQYITDDTDKVRAFVIATEEGVTGGDPPTLILTYSSSAKFTNSSNVRNLDTFDVVATAVTANSIGSSSVASVANGVFYVVNGYSTSSKENDDGTYNKYSIGNFVDVLPQTIILNKYDNTPNARIGLDIVEYVTDYVTDSTLLDPALGASNFQAPGADRYTINLNLTTKKSTDVAGSDSNFIELARVESGKIIRQVNSTSYSQIDDYFAKRTFETNGDFVVNNFSLIPTPNTYSSGSDKYILNVGPGLAYVHGYRTENQSTLKLNGDRARATANINNNIVTPAYGNYFYVNTLAGANGEYIDTTTSQAIDFHICNTSMITTTNTNTYNSTLAATGRLRHLRYATSGSDSDTTSYVYKAHISDLTVKSLTGAISSVNANTITISDSVGKFSTRVANLYGGMTVSIDSGPGAGQIRTVETYFANSTVKMMKISPVFTVLPTTASTFSIKSVVKDIESIVRIGASAPFTIYGSAQIDTRSKVNSISTNDTFVSDAGDAELVFQLGNPYVSSVSDASYVSTQVYRGQSFTTTTTGVYKAITIDVAAQSVLNFIRTGAAESIDSIKQNFIVVCTDKQTNANLTNGQIVPFVGNAVAGLNRTVVVNSQKTTVTFSAPDLLPFTASIYSRMNVIGADNTSYVRKIKGLVTANTTGLGISGLSGTVNTNTLIDLTKGQIYVNSGSAIVTSGLPQSLYVSDVKRIVKIIDPGAATPTLSMLTDTTKDVTNNFSFDNGQRDTYYGHASISLKPGYPIPTRLWILFDFYEHSGGDGYFDVNSYTNENYAEIGTFTSSGGTKYQLRDCIDFRPEVKNVQSDTNVFKYSVTPTPSNFYGSLIPEDESSFTSDYYYYLARKDLLVLTKDSVIKLVQGVPSLTPSYPPEEANSLVLAKLVYDPYTAYIPGEYPGVIPNLSIIPVLHKTWLMKDISGLNDRIQNLEYYTSLNLLEQSASSLQIQDNYGLNRFKNGILVDNFTTFNVADTYNASYAAKIDTKAGTLSPATVTANFHLYNKDFDPVVGKPISVSQAVSELFYRPHKVGTTNVFTLPYTETQLVVQKLASRDVNINSFTTRNVEGLMTISPAVDNWIETATPPSSQGGGTVPPPEYIKIGPIPGTTINAIFTSNNPPTGSDPVYTSQQGDAGQFRNDYGVWGYPDLGRTNKSFNRTYTVTFTKSGYYQFQGAVDDTGTVTLDGTNVFGASGMKYAGIGFGFGSTTNGFNTTVTATFSLYTTLIYVTAGNHTLYYSAINTIDIGCMALKIAYYGETMDVPLELSNLQINVQTFF